MSTSINAVDAKGYATGERKWLYPPKDFPPTGVKLHILQEGGVAIHGVWAWNKGYIAWELLAKRDLEQEAASIEYQKGLEE